MSDDADYSPGRIALVALAAVAVVLGVTSLANVTPLGAVIAAVVDAVGYDWVVPAALGVLALLSGLVVLVSGRGAAMRQTEMPTVERPVPVPAAGVGFDETIAGWRFATRLFGGDVATTVRERLRSAAVATVATTEGCSRAEARQQVEAGTWTDDEAAAAFLAGRYTPLGTWLVALANGQTGPEYRARQTVAAIVALKESQSGVEVEHGGREPSENVPHERERAGPHPSEDGATHEGATEREEVAR